MAEEESPVLFVIKCASVMEHVLEQHMNTLNLNEMKDSFLATLIMSFMGLMYVSNRAPCLVLSMNL